MLQKLIWHLKNLHYNAQGCIEFGVRGQGIGNIGGGGDLHLSPEKAPEPLIKLNSHNVKQFGWGGVGGLFEQP